MGIFFGVGERRRTGGTLVLKGFRRGTIARKLSNWVETAQVRFQSFSMLYLMFNSWWFSDGFGHLFCWLVWTKRPTNCCVEIGSLSVCYVFHYVNVIDSIWKKSAFESVFESDDRNPTLFMLKICFESFLVLTHGSALEMRLLMFTFCSSFPWNFLMFSSMLSAHSFTRC